MFKSGDLMSNLITFRSSDAKRIWRKGIKLRDGFKGVDCGSKEELTIDHVRPACKSGSQAKESLPVEQFLLLTKWQEQQQ